MKKTSWVPLSAPLNDAIAYVRELWDVRSDGALQLRSDACTADEKMHSLHRGVLSPYAASRYDQYSESGVFNPLWEIIRWYPTVDGVCHCTDVPKIHTPYLELIDSIVRQLHRVGLDRQGLCTAFTFSVCTPGDLAWMCQLLRSRSVVELGAGRGYWAHMLRQHGVTVHAYDPCVPGDNNFYFTTAGTFTEVERADHRVVKEHSSDVLFLSWPSYDDTWAYEALRDYRGDMLFYAGEGDGGCTGDDRFHQLLEREWEWLATAPQHVTWWGIHDQLNAYVRK